MADGTKKKACDISRAHVTCNNWQHMTRKSCVYSYVPVKNRSAQKWAEFSDTYECIGSVQECGRHNAVFLQDNSYWFYLQQFAHHTVCHKSYLFVINGIRVIAMEAISMHMINEWRSIPLKDLYIHHRKELSGSCVYLKHVHGNSVNKLYKSWQIQGSIPTGETKYFT